MADETNFPKAGDDKAVSLRNSEYARFDLAYVQDLKDNHPDVWRLGGNIRGNSQFAILSRVQKQGGSPKTRAEVAAVRLREGWAARHYGNKRPPGVVAQMKWLVVGTLGEKAMKTLINDEKGKNDGRSARGSGSGDAPAEPAGGGSDEAPNGVLLRTADVRGVRVETRQDPGTGKARDVVVVSFVASTEDVDSHESILIADWDQEGRLEEYRRNPVILWMHNRTFSTPAPAIGHAENVRVESKKLLLDVVCDDTTDLDKAVAAKLRKGVLRAGSVGFEAGVCEIRMIGDREVAVFSKNKLKEFSIVNIGSNASALATAQRALVATAREMARARGGRVDMADVVAHVRAQRALETTEMRTGTTALSTGVVPAATPPTTPDPARAAAKDPTMKDRKKIDLDERAVRATDTGLTAEASCPHCEAPIEVAARSVPTAKKTTDEIAALTQRATAAEGSLERAVAEKDAVEKRAALLDGKLAAAEAQIQKMREDRVAAEIDARIGKKLDPTERADQVKLSLLDLADQTPDPEKSGSTLGDKAFAARLAKIDARRDIGLLGGPISAGGDGNAAGANPNVGQRSVIDEIAKGAEARLS